MPKLQIKANELVNTDASFVSLVKRGANRIPFRITKEDTEMLDLHKIGRTLFHKADPTPEIVGAIIAPGADLTEVAALFKEAGLTPKEFVKTEQDGIVTVAKAGYEDAKDVALIKMGDDLTVAVSNLKKSFDSYAYNSTDFNAVMSTEGVYPSMCVAKEALGSVISNILYKASSPAEAASMVGAAIDDFKTYMVGLLGAVPMTAFKMDVAVEKSAMGKKKGKGGMSMDDDMEKGAYGKGKAKKDEVPAASDEPPVADPAEGAGEADPVEVEKADAGKNGTGAGFAAGGGTATTPEATSDDAANTAVNSTGEPTTGNADPQVPMGVKKGLTEAQSPQPKGFEPGDPDGFAAAPADTQRAVAAGSADDQNMQQNGGTNGSSIPDGNSGIAAIGGVRKDGEAEEEPDAEAGEAEAGEEEPAPVAKADNDAVLAAIEALQKSLEGSVDEVRKTVSALSARVDGVAEIARKADEAINGTVFNEAGGDAPARTQKADAGAPPLLDTGYSRNVA